MAINPALVGRSYPASAPYEVCRVKIREFADAIGDDNPAYRDRAAAAAAGHDDVVAPPTFAIVLSFVAGRAVIEDPELGVDYSRVVHGEQSFTFTRPIRAGDVLVATPTIRLVRTAGRNEILTVDCAIATAEGAPVCTASNTLVVRGGAGA
jgi:acyl dehydratase